MSLPHGKPAPTPLLCFAHRGASGYLPENTLESFTKALELGSPWIEFDVRVVEDEPVIFHDQSLTRMTGVAGTIEDQQLEYIRSLTVAGKYKIPLLSEALRLLQGHACMQIELKGAGSGTATARLLESFLHQGATAENFLVSSFSENELRDFHSLLPSIPVAALGRELTPNLLALARELRAWSIHLSFKKTIPQCVQSVHAAGFKLFVYTVNSAVDIQTMRSYGVDGVFTDFPDRVLNSPS
jgi:glycerophosphoryl diester phosphodiesterase